MIVPVILLTCMSTLVTTCMSTLGTTRQGLRRDAHGCDAYVSTSLGYSCLQTVADGGIRCSGYVASGAQAPHWQALPISYPARLARTLKLSAQQQEMIRRAMTKRNAATLRFVFLTSDNMIVFYAPEGPCSDAAGGYQVLNYTHSNLYYEPGEDPLHVHAGSTW